jgi:hypothetical protein
MRNLIRMVLEQGVTPEIRALLEARNEESPLTANYLASAKDEWHRDGEVEIDDDAIVSESEEGAYVQAWVWVGRPDADGG